MYEVVRTATVRILERLGYLTVNSKVVSEQLERNFHGADDGSQSCRHGASDELQELNDAHDARASLV